jgi:hypothetical protein
MPLHAHWSRHAHYARRFPNRVASPRRGGFALIKSVTRIVPDLHRHNLTPRLEWQNQWCGVVDLQREICRTDCGPDPSQHWVRTLGQKPTLGIDQHPVSVPSETRGRQLDTLAADTATGLQRIDVEFLDCDHSRIPHPSLVSMHHMQVE